MRKVVGFQFSIRFSQEILADVTLDDILTFNSLSDSHTYLPRASQASTIAFNSLSDSHLAYTCKSED